MSIEVEDKKWLTLNQHGKKCLWSYLCGYYATHCLNTTEAGYLLNKGLIEFAENNKSVGRHAVYIYQLSDIGIETVKHYFPKSTIH